MKIKLISTAIATLALSSVALAQPKQGQYVIDTDHSAVHFAVDHMGFTKIAGRFNQFEGAVDVAKNGSSTLDVKIKTASVDTNHEKRDEHLRSPDFFNAKQFPEIRIEGPVELKEGASIDAQVELLGVSKPVTFTLTKGNEGEDPWGMYRVGYTATAVLKRSDYGMDFMLGGIGDEIQITAYIEAIQK
jgi:polyisoprenoid-binding protein YceI